MGVADGVIMPTIITAHIAKTNANSVAFQGADAVIVAGAHLPGKVPEGQRLSENDLVHAMQARGQDARFIGPVDAIVAHLARELREGDRVVILSNGGFGGIHGKLLTALGAPVGLSR